MWAQHASGGTERFLGSHFDYPRVDVTHPKFKLTHYRKMPAFGAHAH
jgi:hypothetical protein